MRTVTSALVIATVMVVGTATGVCADPFTSSNVRPVQVNLTGQDNLQDILNSTFKGDGPNALTDQTPVSMWTPATTAFAINPVLEFQQNCTGCSYGIWSGTDSANITMVTLFSGADSQGDYPATINGFQDGAVVEWSTTSTTTGRFITPTSPGWINFSGIDSNAFGFYLQQVTGTGASMVTNTYYTADALNTGGIPGALTYQDSNSTNWAIAFDTGTDNDFTNGVLSVESLDAAMPEPGTLALFASGLFVGIGKLRSRFRR